MSAAPKLADKASLKNLVPLNGLTAAHFDELAKKATILELKPGKYLFKKGERDSSTCYILEGEIALVDGSDIKLTIQGGTEEAKHPIAPQQPRQLGARAKTRCTVISIDSGLLDVMLAWEQSASYEVDDIDADDEDWMTRMMQSELLQRLPANNLQQLFMRMEEIKCKASEVIVNQDDEGDYYYIIKQGICIVSRRPSANAREVKLAELSDGDSFGEESLLSGAKRNASVTMLTDGILMRLSKNNFNELLKSPLLSQLSYQQVKPMVEDGAILVDVRLPGEYANAHLKNSINLPLAAIRSEINSLDTEKEYIVYCDTGRRSTSAVFLMGQFGLDASILKDGLSSVPMEDQTGSGESEGADVIDIHRERNDSAAGEFLNEDVTTLQKEKIELEKTVTMLSGEIASLKEQIAHSEENIAKGESQLQETTMLIEQEQQAVRDLEEELQDLKSIEIEYDRLKEQFNKVESQANEQEKLLKNALDSDEVLQTKIMEQQNRIIEVEAELSRARQNETDAETMHAATTSKIESVTAELDVIKKEKEQLQVRLDEITREKENLAHEAGSSTESLQQEVQALQQSLSTLQEEKKAQDAELQQQRNHAETLQQQLESLGASQSEQQQNLEKVQAELDQQTANYLQVQTEKDALTQELQQARDQLHAGNNDAQSVINNLQEEITAITHGKLAAEEQQQLAVKQIAEHEILIDRLKTENEQLLHDRDSNAESLQKQISEAQSSRDELKNESQRLAEKIAEYEGTIAALKEQLDMQSQESEQKLNELSTHVAAESEKNASLESQLNERQQQVGILQQEVEALTAQAANVQLQLDEALQSKQHTEENNRQRIAELQGELDAAVEQHSGKLTALQQTLADSEDSLEKEQAQIAELNARLQSLEAERNGLQEHADQLVTDHKNQLARLEAELEQKQANLQDHEESIARMQSAEKQYKFELETARAEQTKLGVYTEKVKLLEQERNVLTEQYEQARTRIDELSEIIRKHESGNDDEATQQELNDLRTTLKDTQDLLLDKDSQLKGLQENELALQAELTELKQASKDREAELANTKEQLEHIQEHQKSNEDSQRAVETALTNELTELRETHSKTKDELAALNAELANARGQLDEMAVKQQDHEKLTSSSEALQQQLTGLQQQYNQKHQHFKELQTELQQTQEKLTTLQQQDNARQDSEKAAVEELRLVRQRSEEHEQETHARIAELEDALKEKEQALSAIDGQANEALLLRSDAESAYKVMEAEMEKIRQEASDYESTISSNNDQIAQLQSELEKLREQQQQWRVTEKDLADKSELEIARQHVDDLQREIKELTAKLDVQQSTAQHSEPDAQQELDAKISQLKSEMEIQLGQYKSELDEESSKLTKENEALRKELLKLHKDHEKAIQTGQAMQEKNSVAKTVKSSSNDADLFDLPDINANILGANNTVTKTNWLMVIVIALLFSAGSAAAVYWHFVLNAGTVPAPVAESSKTITAMAKPVAQPVKTPVKTVKKAPVSTKKVVASKSGTSGSLKPTRIFSDFLSTGGSGPVMVGVPSGIFTMGSPANSTHFDERPQHTVSLRKFSISKYEVTFDDYDRFSSETGRPRPSDNGWGRGKRPVINVTWDDAVAYTAWLSEQTGHVYKLPSEAQWEYAARAGNKAANWWGADYPGNTANCFNCGSEWDRISTAPVGSFDASSLSLHDMAGNVMEWVEDCYHKNYSGAPIDGSVWSDPSCQKRVVRDGSYHSTLDNIRGTKRSAFTADTAVDQIGFRVVRIR